MLSQIEGANKKRQGIQVNLASPERVNDVYSSIESKHLLTDAYFSVHAHFCILVDNRRRGEVQG